MSAHITLNLILPTANCFERKNSNPQGGTRSIHDRGGGDPTELHITNPKKYTSLKF